MPKAWYNCFNNLLLIYKLIVGNAESGEHMKTIKISKTTKQNVNYLIDILDDIMAAESFVMSDRTVVARTSHGSCANEYHCPNSAQFGIPAFVVPILKQAGSELCYMFNARQKLQHFIEQAKQLT